jgi:putative ABC transport system permease protein
VHALPGVTAVGLGSHGPLDGAVSTTTIKSLDGAAVDADRSPLVVVGEANAELFSALRVPLRKGRMFDAADVGTAQRVALVNEAGARALFSGRSAVGRQIATTGGMEGPAIIVGVVGNVRQFPDSAAPPEIFIPLSQFGQQRLEVFVRTSQDPASLAPTVRRTLRALDPTAAIDHMQTMDERTGASTARARFGTMLIALFAATALLLAVIGVYGVMSLAVGARTREIGVRIALGADSSRVRRLVVADAMTLVLIGGSLGIAGAVLSTRVLRSLLFELTTTDPATYVGVAVVMIAAALVAAWIPARRASRIDPMQALRVD